MGDKRNEICLITSKTCFLCCSQLPNPFSDNSDNKSDFKEKNFSLQSILRYLKINQISSISNILKNPEVFVSLCNDCGRIVKDFTKHFEALEVCRIKVESSLEDILTKLESNVNSGDEEARKQNKILTEVRQKVMNASKSRKKGLVPQVLIQKLNTVRVEAPAYEEEMIVKVEPEETENGFLQPPEDAAPVEDTIYDEEEEMKDVEVEPEEPHHFEVDSLEETKPDLDSFNISVMQCNPEENEAGDKPESESQSFIISSGVAQKGVKEEIRPGIPKKPKKCRFCPKMFLFRSTYKTHVEREHQDPLSTEKAKPSEHLGGDGAPTKNFKCRYCPKSFSRCDALNLHLVMKHIDLLSPEEFKQLANFKCKFCGKYFMQMNALNIHLVSHTGATPYKCSWCGISYARKHSLSMHVRRKHNRQSKHNLEENRMENKIGKEMELNKLRHCPEEEEEDVEVVCEVCNKKFKNARCLQSHSWRHVGYECKYCDKKLRSVLSLNAHLAVHLGAP